MENSEDLSRHIKQLKDNIWLVPCNFSDENHTFEPLVTMDAPHSMSARNWMFIEDDMILKIIETHGMRGWTKCANKINKRIHSGICVRTSKQCRARWLNHLNPTLIKSKWTDEEDKTLLE